MQEAEAARYGQWCQSFKTVGNEIINDVDGAVIDKHPNGQFGVHVSNLEPWFDHIDSAKIWLWAAHSRFNFGFEDDVD